MATRDRRAIPESRERQVTQDRPVSLVVTVSPVRVDQTVRVGQMAHRDQIADFTLAVREDREPFINVEEGRKPLAIIAAIYESARTGRPVRVEEWEPSGGIP